MCYKLLHIDFLVKMLFPNENCKRRESLLRLFIAISIHPCLLVSKISSNRGNKCLIILSDRRKSQRNFYFLHHLSVFVLCGWQVKDDIEYGDTNRKHSIPNTNIYYPCPFLLICVEISPVMIQYKWEKGIEEQNRKVAWGREIEIFIAPVCRGLYCWALKYPLGQIHQTTRGSATCWENLRGFHL